VEHDQEILSGSRSTCSFAIMLVWIIEILFLVSLVAVAVATLFDEISAPFSNVPNLLVLLGCAAAAIVSIAVTGIAVASLSNAIANIDTRNIQLEQLLTIRQRQQVDFIAPARNRRTADIDSMRFRPERVT